MITSGLKGLGSGFVTCVEDDGTAMPSPKELLQKPVVVLLWRQSEVVGDGV